MQGFCELAERDAVALWWYNRLRRPAVDLNSLPDPYVSAVRALYADLGDKDSLISETTVGQLEKLLEGGALTEGMIPKITAVIRALRAGVPQAHILDGRVAHALLLEVFTEEGVGTMVLP